MTPRRLSDSDKQQILELYRQPGETTSTLAARYGVSNSTISRILKNSFSEEEYEALIQQKRGRSANESVLLPEDTSEAASPSSTELSDLTEAASVVEPLAAEVSTAQAVTSDEPTASGNIAPPIRRSRRRSSAQDNSSQLELDTHASANGQSEVVPPQETLAAEPTLPLDLDRAALNNLAAYDSQATVVEEILNEELIDQEDDLTGLDDDLDEDEDDLDDDLDDDDLDQGALLVGSRIEGKTLVQVLPLAEASIPRTCYLVVERSAELIARPLKEFGDLGQIPEAEIQEKTLPVFDNHRVAKRYSNPRTQRVIKLPDGKVLQKTSSHLQAKGITRLLIDGQVYSLESLEDTLDGYEP